MREYVKPIVELNNDLAEGIYANSGAVTVAVVECDSKYMQGVYQAGAYGVNVSVKDYYGCQGCPAYRAGGCGLAIDQAYLNGAQSYDTDDGRRYPAWEGLGYTPEYIIDAEHPAPY